MTAASYDFSYRATFSGTLGTSEIFAHHQIFTSESADPEYVADNLSSHVTNMLATSVVSGPFSTLASAFPTWVEWTRLHVEPIDNTGALLPGGPASTDRVLTDAGTGSGSLGLPYQTSLAVTIRNAPLGRRNKNRFYLPPMVIGATNGQGVVATPVLNAIAAWLVNQQTAFEALSPAIEMDTWSPAAASFSLPTDIYLGSLIDTQRRRRNAIDEARIITSF